MKSLTYLIRILALGVFLLLVTRGKMMLWLVLYAGSLLAGLFFGRIYCGYLCPMNTLMEPTEWLSKRLHWQAKEAPKWLQNRYLPWVTLIISLASMILAKKLLHKDIPVLMIWLVISVLVTLRCHPAVFHNLICPFGALQKLVAHSPWLVKHVQPSLCIGCKKCEQVCPSQAVQVGSNKKAVITPAVCHQYQNCSTVCPTGAIKYGKKA